MLIDMAKLERTRAARACARIIALASLASLAFLAAASLTFAPAFAQTGPAATAAPVQAAGADASPPQASAKTAAAPGKKVSPFRQANPTYKAKELYQSVWGVDHLSVEQTASGNLIRFKYRVVDPKLARPLNAKEAPASLINPRNRAMLQIPVMDNVGQLRQTGTPKAGEEYWMTFSNKGNMVKRGD